MDRFWRKVDTTGGPDACWPWLASKQRAGKKRIKARRAWAQEAA